MGKEIHKKILTLLKEKQVPYQLLKHEHVHTSKDAATIRGTKIEQAAKALVLKEKVTGKLYLFIVAGNRKLNLRKIKKEILHIKNISLAPVEEVQEKTTCTVGSVPPFGNLFNLPTYFDTHLKETQKEIVFCAGTHYESIKMKTKDFIYLVQPTLADFGVQP